MTTLLYDQSQHLNVILEVTDMYVKINVICKSKSYCGVTL